MDTMKALRFERYGAPEVLSIATVPFPRPGAGEVLVQIMAAAVNPSDVKIVAGVIPASLPGIPGRDYAGLVVDGDGPVGSEVWGSGAGFGITRPGAHAQFVVVPSTWLSSKPAALSMEQAAAVGIPYMTAWTALMRATTVDAGETVLITGAGGAVGQAAAQIARWRGARVIGTHRGARPPHLDVAIDVTKSDLPAAVREATDGRGANLVFDTVGGPLFEPALKSLAVCGRQVAISSASQRRVSFDLADFYHGALRLIGVDTTKLSGQDIASILDSVREGFDAGRFVPVAVQRRPLEEAADAYRLVGAGSQSAKQILIPN